MSASKKATLIVFVYVAFIYAVMTSGCLAPDTYYYWQWSRHLALSYYDGSPMIAYLIYFITALFGNSSFSLLMVGMFAAAITSGFLYKISQLLFRDDRAALFSIVVWLTAVVTLRHFFVGITYDTALILFWASTYYFFLKLGETRKTQYYYLCGTSIGLMLLSKYTGVLLCISLLLVCLVYSKYRFILRNKHAYFAILLAIALFLPVVYWNYQHGWASFLYQLGKGASGQFNPIMGLKNYLKYNLLNFNVYFILFLSMLISKGKTLFTSDKLGVLTIPTLLIWLFFFLMAIKTVPDHGDSWNSESFFSAALLLGLYLSSISRKWMAIFVIALAIIPALLFLFMSRFPAYNPRSGWSNVYAAKQLLSNVPKNLYQGKVIYHDGQYWLSSFIGYFLPDHPNVYSVNKYGGNQFYFWNLEDRPAAVNEKVRVFSYQSVVENPHFHNCHPIWHGQYLQKNLMKENKIWSLYLFDCVYLD